MSRFLVAVAVFCSLICASLAFPKKSENEASLQVLPADSSNVENLKWFFPIRPGFLPWIPINIPTRPPPGGNKEDDKKEDDKKEDEKKDDEKKDDEKKDEEKDKEEEKPEDDQ